MYTSNIDPKLSKEHFYKELLTQVKSIIDGDRYWVTNAANATSLIYHALNSMDFLRGKVINWVGIYVTDKNDAELLRLGPFQGKVACNQIKFGKGVCGTAAAKRQAQIVPDVHNFPGHIACDSGSNSEIVLPILRNAAVIGVLDIDCLQTEAFDTEDKMGLEKICEALAEGCDW